MDIYTINIIFSFLVFIASVVVHEVAHALAADLQGDPTARYAGLITLNPLKHIDIYGSILVPLVLIMTHANFLVGWAKPVPYNPYALRNKKWGELVVASAGVTVNILIAIIFGTLIRFSSIFGSFSSSFISIATVITRINLLLALFNLMPIPPLDGSKIFPSFLPKRFVHRISSKVEYLALPLLVFFIIFIWPLVFPFVGVAFHLITGMQSTF